MRKLFITVLLLIITLVQAATLKNVIIVIGDGMGFNHLYLSTMLAREMGVHPITDDFPVTGLGINQSKDNLITDSAAAATAFFSGIITRNGYAGLDPEGKPVKTLLDIFNERDWWTGMITGTRFYDGTPAALFAHAHRDNTRKITEDLLKSDFDLFFAAGLEKLGVNPFTQKPMPQSDINSLVSRGYRVLGVNFCSIGEPEAEPKGVMAFVSMGDKNFENQLFPDEPTFSQMLDKALDNIDPSRGVFLVVEAGRIDDASHANDIAAVKAELLEFQKLLNTLVDRFDFEKTLLVVLADHETGGLFIPFGTQKVPSISWGSGDHTASYVPVLAMGNGQELFTGIYHICEIPGKILSLLEVEE